MAKWRGPIDGLPASGAVLTGSSRRAYARRATVVVAVLVLGIKYWVCACHHDAPPFRADHKEERMSKSSTVTVRETPVQKVASVTAGGFVIHGENFIIDTDDRIELVDLTDKVMNFVRQFKIKEGMITLWSMHTTCAVFINEFQRALLVDIKKFLEEMVARDRYYMHNDPDHSDCDRMNADSHLRAMLLGHSLTLQISGGEVVLGQWQRILMAELDGPRARTLRAQVVGIS
jgi:secondary thiamine-phosphate synthase enzyme